MGSRVSNEADMTVYDKQLRDFYHYFHRYPELALKEVKTSAFIRKRLEGLGYQIREVAPTGLIAELPCLAKRAPLVVLRAEMDGLPIQEQTGLPYASVNDGCMHACGHDAILAVALTMAEAAAKMGEEFPVRIRFLFEPAEEIGEGAKRMLQAGALKDADCFVMFHFATDMPFGMAVHEGQASAMIGGMQIHIEGKSSHWCEAQKGIDSIYGAARVIEKVHEANEKYERQAPCLAGIGIVQGGSYPNIIADYVLLQGNVRACREEDFYGMIRYLEEGFAQVEKETGTTIKMEFPKEPVYPFANDRELTEMAVKTGKKVFGDRFVLEGEDKLFLTGDNAYRYFRKTKGIFPVFLAALPGENHPLHHPKFQIDEEILPYSLEALFDLFLNISQCFAEKQPEGKGESAE